MCSPPLGTSAVPASQRRKNKKHFTAFHPVHPSCTPTYTRYTHEKDTQQSVIYPPLADQTKTHKNAKQHHNTVFFNTTAWVSHPHASPEGHGTTPSDKYQGWPTAGPLEAAMWLTALRQPKDISEPKNYKKKDKNQTPLMIYTPSSFKTAILSLQKPENATTRECTPSRTAAQYKSPVNMPALTIPLSPQPPT